MHVSGAGEVDVHQAWVRLPPLLELIFLVKDESYHI